MPHKPTLRQKRLAKIMTEDTSKTMGQAMLQAGYSPFSAMKPQLTVDTPTFQALLDKYLPDRLLTKTHKDLLKAKKLVMSPTEPDRWVPDWNARGKGVELGYKVKGRLVDNATQVNIGDVAIKVIEDKPITRGDE